MEIAILLLNNYGDILYATPLAKQIKMYDFPGSHITWIVAKQYSSILTNNPYVDKLEIVENVDFSEINSNKWEAIKLEYLEKQKSDAFDRLFILQPVRANLKKYRNSIRRMIFDAYPFKIKIPISPLIFLSDGEKGNVNSFIQKNKIGDFKNRILFEFSPSSGQSNISKETALNLAERIVNSNESTCVIFSSNQDLDLKNPNLFNANSITFKENAELLNYCTLLLGCSSGISWLSTSSWCKPIQTIQFLKLDVPWFNSMKADFKFNNLQCDHLIELYKFQPQDLLDVVTVVFKDNFQNARGLFDQNLPANFLDGNFRTIANELSNTSHKDFIFFIFKNWRKPAIFNRFYLEKVKKYSEEYLIKIFKTKSAARIF